MKRKLTACLMSLVFAVLLFPLNAFAVNLEVPNTWSLEVSSSGEQYLINNTTGEITVKAFRPDSAGNLVEISLEECLEIKNSAPYPSPVSYAVGITGQLVSPNSTNYETVLYDYRQTSSSTGYGSPVKVSADAKGPATISYLESRTISCSYGGSISITSAIQNAIKSGSSFSWNTSASSASQLSYSFSVPSGKTGYVQFTPILNVTRGNIYQIYVSSYGTSEKNLGTVWGNSPKAIGNGMADGIYELVVR